MAKAIINGQTIFGNVHLGQGGSNMHDYSTDEQIVGTWIDGSTIYEKTIYCDAFPNNTTKDLSTPSDINLLLDAEGFARAMNLVGYFRTLPFVGGGSNDIRVDLNAGTLRITTYGNWSSYDGYITIRYTKSST